MQVATVPPTVSLDDPAHYINRELSWLEFNRRVLEEAQDPQVPLLERLKFLTIVSSNLDEFFMVRVGGLQQKVQAHIAQGSGADRMPPAEQLEKISQTFRQMVEQQYQCFMGEVLPALDVRRRSRDASQKILSLRADRLRRQHSPLHRIAAHPPAPL